MFNNVSARSAIERFLSVSKRTQALTIQPDRCFAPNSKMATMIIMGFREVLCMHYFQILFFGMTMFVYSNTKEIHQSRFRAFMVK